MPRLHSHSSPEMFYVPEGKLPSSASLGGEQEMVHCEGGTTRYHPAQFAARALRQLRDLSLFLDSIQSLGRIVGDPEVIMRAHVGSLGQLPQMT